MRFVIQRVSHASVTVREKVIGEIQKGFLVFIGVGREDTEAIADKYIRKMLVCGSSKTHRERRISH